MRGKTIKLGELEVGDKILFTSIADNEIVRDTEQMNILQIHKREATSELILELANADTATLSVDIINENNYSMKFMGADNCHILAINHEVLRVKTKQVFQKQLRFYRDPKLQISKGLKDEKIKFITEQLNNYRNKWRQK